MSSLKWVLFDLYDTLVIVHNQHRWVIEEKVQWKAFQRNGILIDRQAFYEKLQELKHQYDHNDRVKPPSGTIEVELAQYFGHNISLDLGKKIHHAQYEGFDEIHRAAPFAKELFEWLKSQNYQIGVISNGHPKDADYNLKEIGLRDYVDDLVTSEEVQGLKSTLKPFQKFFENHPDVKPEECLFVGDSIYEDTYSQKVGIPACIFEFNVFEASERKINELKQNGLYPQYHINTLEDLKELVKDLIS